MTLIALTVIAGFALCLARAFDGSLPLGAALDGVPREEQPLMARAEEFLRLRDESRRLRVAALQEGDAAGLQRADEVDTTPLELLQSIDLTAAVRQ